VSANLLNRGEIKRAFQEALASQPIVQMVDDIAAVKASDVESERYAVPFATPKFAERIGPKTADQLGSFVFDLPNKMYDAAVSILDLAKFFSQVDVWQETISALAESAALLKWELLVDQMINGNASTNLSYDGKNFYSATHSMGDSGTQLNLLTASEVASLNVVATGAVTPEEMSDILVGLASYILRYKDDKGRAMNRNVKDFVAVVPADMFGPALSAIYANNLASGKTNVVRAVQAGGYSFDVVLEPELTTQTVGFIHAKTPGRKPFILQEARAARIHILDESSEHYAQNGECIARSDWTGRAGRGEPLRSARFTVS
jgi:hypothetical protein